MKRKPIIHKLLLETKVPIPFKEAQLVIMQPSIKEIGLINESVFFIALNSLTKDYVDLKIEDNLDLTKLSNFEIFMSIIREKSENSKFIFSCVMQLFSLIFPNYKVGATPSSIIFYEQIEGEEKPQIHMIDKDNFDIFSQLLYDMFGLAELTGVTQTEYNPAGDRARALVKKFEEKRALLAKLRQDRGENPELNSVFGRYIEILAVGENKDKNELINYSVYQLIEEFKRFQLKETFDYTQQAKMAGATKIKDARDWMEEITFGQQSKDD